MQNNTHANKKKVVVTGASGYIALWIVKKLLEEGHDVHATVRSLAHAEKVLPIKKQAEGTAGTLTLFEADLLQAGSFDSAMKGCDILIHTASPFVLSPSGDPYETFINPAVKGTENVLAAASKTSSIKKVVLTSSTAAITNSNKDAAQAKNGMLDESYWNEEQDYKVDPYRFSKTTAEKRAWDIAKNQTQWKLVVINPGGVLGPSLTEASVSGTIDMMKQLVAGKMAQGVPGISIGMVDVRDVAEAHIKAVFSETASGRYILVEKVMSFLDIANVLRSKYEGQIALPKKEIPKWLFWLLAPKVGFTRKFVSENANISIKIDNSKSRNELGIMYNKLEDGILEQVGGMLETS